MPRFSRTRHLFLIFLGTFATIGPATADHRVLLQGNGRLAIIEPDGRTSWEMPWGEIHDIHLLPNGNILTRQGHGAVVEIDRETKQVVWRYDSTASPENSDRRVEVHAFQPLDHGRVMIAESGAARIIEVGRDGRIAAEVPLVVDNPNPHSDTRLARKLDSGNYLVAHEADGKVREYDAAGEVVWEYEVPMFGREPANGHGPEGFGNRLFAALRLPSGNTLIATGNGHSVLEVTPDKEIVWQLHQDDLPGIRLAWVTTLEVLPGGNYVIGNCHAGPGQPLLVEIDPKSKEVVWTFARHADFGNNVSNSLLLDVSSIR
jgi:outer membrane protein assembly factor BamB